MKIMMPRPATAAAPEAKPSPPKLEKLALIGIDFKPVFGKEKILEGQYNPKEISIKKSANWTEHKSSTSDRPELEFTDGGTRTLTFELMFDTFETGEDVHEMYVEKLFALASVMKEEGFERQKRPSRVRVAWGPDLPRFEGVIENVDVKYTMFLPSGRPVRATCNITMKEATKASFVKKER